jgi:hypothetical protein
MATTVYGSSRLYVDPDASLGASFGTHTVEEVTLTQSGEAPVESVADGSYSIVAVKDASKVELSVTFLTNATVTIPAIGTAHTFDHMPEVEIFAMPDGINDTSTTGKWTLTEVTNPVAYDQVQRCTATFVKWSGMKRS